MAVNLGAVAASISRALKQRTGVTVPSSVILQHFQAEGTSAGNNYAGLMSGGQLIHFGSLSSFQQEYLNTVAPHLLGAIKQKLIFPGSTVTPQQYAAALQHGTANPYCASNCGTFYQQGTSFWQQVLEGLGAVNTVDPYSPVIGPSGKKGQQAGKQANSQILPSWLTWLQKEASVVGTVMLGLFCVVLGVVLLLQSDKRVQGAEKMAAMGGV